MFVIGALLGQKRHLNSVERSVAAATRNCRLTLGLVTLILRAHGALLCYSSTTHSPVNGEPAAIASGVFSWSKGQFTLFRVNPPLSHMIAALPIVVMGAETDWREAIDKVAGRPEFRVRAAVSLRSTARTCPYFWYVPDGVAFRSACSAVGFVGVGLHFSTRSRRACLQWQYGALAPMSLPMDSLRRRT